MLEASIVVITLTNILFRVRKIYKSPLRQIPGPRCSIFTEIWLIIQEFAGNRRLYIHELHKKYGPVVRLGPNEVSFISADAVKEIYAAEGSGYEKTELYTLFMQFGVRTMFSSLLKADVGGFLIDIYIQIGLRFLSIVGRSDISRVRIPLPISCGTRFCKVFEAIRMHLSRSVRQRKNQVSMYMYEFSRF